jgi:hypothetical protein
MLGAVLLWCAFGLTRALQNYSDFGQEILAAYTLSLSPAQTGHYEATCEKIAQSISSASQVFYPGKLHWSLMFITR